MLHEPFLRSKHPHRRLPAQEARAELSTLYLKTCEMLVGLQLQHNLGAKGFSIRLLTILSADDLL
jgi:hypothetical protein